MPVAAGELDTLVDILELRDVKNEIGEQKPVWAPVARAWAKIEPISTRDYLASSAEGNSLTAKIVLRNDIDINATHRILIVDTGFIYTVNGVIPIPADHKKSALCSVAV
jgi:SPP1 family predicted phage head-tail adaptor